MTLSPGVYRIRNYETRAALDQGAGGVVQGWEQNDSDQQQWFLQNTRDGAVVLRNVHFGQYVYATDIRNGGRVFPSNNATAWKLIPDGERWIISLPGTKYIVEVGGGERKNGAAINVYEEAGGEKHPNQRWLFEKLNDKQPEPLP